ncbi:MAG: glutamate-5-semialdehyde dehydrogenase [Oscillospiraceae bacterium]|nr:glutamate-5-semialdehyde dehydrogenase [Oscillospiraceae bacterium]
MILDLAKRVKACAPTLGTSPQQQRDAALTAIAELLISQTSELLIANQIDLDNGTANGLSPALLDRLRLTPQRVESMADGVRQLIAAHDPIGGSDSVVRRPNGLRVETVRVPLGTIGMIYESRPNVTIDAAALCLKSGNCVLLRGGKEAIESNKALSDLCRKALGFVGLPADCVALITDTTRQSVTDMVALENVLDVVIPRGGAALKTHVTQHARVPVIAAAGGVVHIYVDASAKLDNAIDIIDNAKRQRPSVCNAVETVLIHKSIATSFLPKLAKKLHDVELRGGQCCQDILGNRCKPATDEDFAAEHGDLTLTLRIIDDIDVAIEHIAQYGSGHTECILTSDLRNAEQFAEQVDAAAVIVNASTRFTDGECFGLGAEIGISTQKLHARGPMGLRALTTIKYVIHGGGQIRK